MGDIRRLGVLTSGGDCAGLNAVIRAVVQRAVRTYGWKVLGIKDGTMGLMDRPLQYRELDLETFSGGVLREGGTLLGTTNKGDPFNFPMPDGTFRDRSMDFVDGFNRLRLDALVVIGGDGSMNIVSRLCERGGIGMVGVPKTIDNDVHGTDYAVGFSTACAVVTDALDRLQPTAASHHRVMILEVMGRDAGHIAINSGIAGGADVILIPEVGYTLDGITRKIRGVLNEGRSHALIVVAEGVRTESGEKATVAQADGQIRYGGIGQYLTHALAQRLPDVETRVTVLGHVQRGGAPDARDRMLASSFGVHAVDLVAAGQFGRMVAWQNRGVTSVPLEEATIGPRSLEPDGPLIGVARGLGTYVGEEDPARATETTAETEGTAAAQS